MLDAAMKATRSLRLDQRARCHEEVMLDVDVEKKMASFSFEPMVTSKSVSDKRTLV